MAESAVANRATAWHGEEGFQALLERRGQDAPIRDIHLQHTSITLEREGNTYGLDEDQNNLEQFLLGRAEGLLNRAGKVRVRGHARKSIWCVLACSYLGQSSWGRVKERDYSS